MTTFAGFIAVGVICESQREYQNANMGAETPEGPSAVGAGVGLAPGAAFAIEPDEDPIAPQPVTTIIKSDNSKTLDQW